MSTKRSSYYSALVLVRALVFAVFAAHAMSAVAADFPKLQQQIDSTSRAFGTGTCATQRTGVWLADGGVVVEVQRPREQCVFATLHLVVDGERLALSAVDDNFFFGVLPGAWAWNNQDKSYQWTAGAGKLFFRTERKIEASKIQGILEVGCNSSNCLNEAAATQAQRQ